MTVYVGERGPELFIPSRKRSAVHCIPSNAISVRCPACGQAVSVDVKILGIETVGLALTGVDITAGAVSHDCPSSP